MKYETLVRIRTMSDTELADICFRMADKHPETFIELVEADVKHEFEVPFVPGLKVKFSASELSELRSYNHDRKITCIKRIREITGIGLKEAKDMAEITFGLQSQIGSFT
jgi:ribosomal protein L7/L12